MNVHEIVREWLCAHGYHGLCHIDAECGCELSDLAPCGEMGKDCQPGYKRPPTEEQRADGAEWAIWSEKPESAELASLRMELRHTQDTLEMTEQARANAQAIVARLDDVNLTEYCGEARPEDIDIYVRRVKGGS